MAALSNLWQVHDITEPLLVWHLRLPAPADVDADAAVDDALAVLDDSGLLRTRRPLPLEVAVYEGTAPRAPTLATVREAGQLTDILADDAGALLRRLEGPGLDAGYARHFAATGHPFVSAWTNRGPGSVELCVAFFTTLHFDERDGDVFARNHARVVAAHDGLLALARRRGGRLIAPVRLTKA